MRIIVGHPVLALVIAAVVTVALGSRIPTLRTDVTPTTMMVANDPEKPIYEAAKLAFGSDNLTAVVVKADDIFTATPLEAIERLSDALAGLDGVTRVDSLSTVNDIKGSEDSLATDPLMDDGVPQSHEGLEALRHDALRNPIIAGNLVSPDARAAGIFVYTQSAPGDADFDEAFSSAVDALIAAEHERSGLEIYQIGQPYFQAMLSRTVIGDQVRLLPLALAVLAIVLIVMFRSTHVVVISALARLTTIVWALGWMALLDYPVTLLTALIPMLVVIVGFTEDVHFISEYHEQLRDGLGKRPAIDAAAQTVGTPLLVTSFTTAVGFGSLSLSAIVILGQLGRVAALAFASSYVVTLLIVPASLRFWPTPTRMIERSRAANAEAGLVRWLRGLGETVVAHRRVTFLVGAAVFAMGLLGASRVYVDNDGILFFRSDTALRHRVDDIEAVLTGSSMFYVVVETTEEGRAASAEVQHYVDRLQHFIDSTGEVSRTLSAADYIKLMNRELHGGDDRYFTVPDSDELIAQYLVLLHPDDIEKHLAYDRNSTNIIVRHNIKGLPAFNALLAEIRSFADETAPPSIHVHLTSEGILQARAADSLAAGMVTGMGYTIVIVALICSLFFMSWRAGAMALPPNLLPIAVAFGILGFCGIPLNVGTAMIASIAIGIAVDDTVHYMARNAVELDRLHDPVRAMRATLGGEGRAIVATSVALAAGFLVLTVSTFLPLAFFGVISAIVMLVALTCDLTLTPALMASTRLITLWNVVGLKMHGDIVEKAPLLRGLTHWEARKIVLLGRLRTIGAGEYAVHEGDPTDRTMYLVISGRLRALTARGDRERMLAVLEPGALFGEIALADAGTRSADVVAETDSEVLVLSDEDLDRIRRRFPRIALKLFQNLARILSRRLRDTTRAIAEG